jgi:ATP-dependent DNA ligase
MTTLVPELARIDCQVVLDGELVAFGGDGKPSQPRLCRRLLAGDRSIAIVFVAFDVLAVDGRAVDHEP